MATGWAELVAAGTKRPMASLVRDYGEGREPKTSGGDADVSSAADIDDPVADHEYNAILPLGRVGGGGRRPPASYGGHALGWRTGIFT